MLAAGPAPRPIPCCTGQAVLLKGKALLEQKCHFPCPTQGRNPHTWCSPLALRGFITAWCRDGR